MNKTIKQIADEIGVSKQAIHQRIKRHPELKERLQPFTTTVDGTVYIDVDGENIVKSAFSSIKSENTVNTTNTIDNNVDVAVNGVLTALQSTIDILQKQLSEKDSQLSTKDLQILEKDKQISELTAALVSSQEQHKALTDALTAAQALHAGTIQERLTDNSMAASEAEPVEEKKKGFFARLFGKN